MITREHEDYLLEGSVPEVTCSICDGLGHGQPGYGPCPLELYEPVRLETEEEELYFA